LSGQATLTYSYQYDGLDRLTQVDNGTAAQRQTFGYDIFGNRVKKLIGNPVSAGSAYAYDAAHQLTEVRQTNLSGAMLEAYLYDDTGNQSKKCSGGTVTRPSGQSCTGSSQSQYQYDSFQRLNRILVNGTTTGQYRYDHQGRRIQKTEGATVTHYLYDGPNIYAEYSGTSWYSPNAVYVQAGLDQPLARLTGSVASPLAAALYYHQDGLSSVLAVTDATKAITATQRFDAFGNKVGGANSVRPYSYTGREPDASGLIYYRARYYDPNQARFTQRDPLGYTDGINPYSYVHNDPVNFNDPSGTIANSVTTWTKSQDQNYYSLSSSSLTISSAQPTSTSSIFTGQSYLVADASGKVTIGGSEVSCGQRLCNQIGEGPTPVDILKLGTNVTSNLVSPEVKLGGVIAGGVIKGVTKGGGNIYHRRIYSVQFKNKA